MSNSNRNIEKTRNTSAQLDWYERRRSFLQRMDAETMSNNFPVFSSRQQITRFIETFRYWELVKDVPGNILECGVAGGSFLFAMAHFSAIYEPHHYTRKVIGFDTFEGFTPPSQEDLSSNAKHMKAGGMAFDSYDYLQEAIEFYDQNRMIGNLPKILLRKGDVSETLPRYLEENPACVIGLLHLDLDLYTPTRDVLKLVRNRMPKGSVIVFDEINHGDYPGETLAIMEVMGLENLRLQRVSEASMAAYVRL